MDILIIRPNVSSNSDGINRYCLAIKELFKDDKDIKILPIENYPGRYIRLFNCIFYFRYFFHYVRQLNPDIIHINGYLSLCIYQSFLVAKLLKKKIVYTAHWHPYENLRRPIGGKLFFNLLLKPLIKRWANVIITLNNEDTKYFKSFSHTRVRQIPHWCHYKLMCNKSKKVPNMILFIGRINDPNKGIEHLYKLPIGQYQIHIVGPGDIQLRSDMIRHINISNEELISLYLKATVVVIPSKYEAFSYVALESLMLGTPIVMTKNVKIYDYLEGVSGVAIFEYGNYIDFNNKIQQVTSAIVDKGKIDKIFNITEIHNKYKDIYNCK